MLPVRSDDPRNENPKFIWRMAKVGLVGFGGGSVLIPLLERELVQGVGISQKHFIQSTIIANITPGALPVKIAALSGVGFVSNWRVLLSTIAMATPGTIALILLLVFISFLSESAILFVEYASVGISSFILYLLFGFILKVIKPGGIVNKAFLTVTLVSFLITGADRSANLIAKITGWKKNISFFELNALQLIVVSLIVLALYTLAQTLFPRTLPTSLTTQQVSISFKFPLKLAAINVIVGIILLVSAYTVTKDTVLFQTLTDLGLSTATSFGGGEAYVGVADSYFVSTNQVSNTIFYGQIVPIANALPGPILIKIASGIIFTVTSSRFSVFVAILLALLTMVIVTNVSTSISLIFMSGFGQIGNSRYVRNVSQYMMPVVCGLLISTAVSLTSSSAAIATKSGLGFIVCVLGIVILGSLAPAIHRKIKIPDIFFVLLYGSLTLILLISISQT